MATEKDAIGSESSPDNTGVKSPSGGGNHPQKTQEQLLAEAKMENERKAAEIAELKAAREATEARITELEEKINLSAGEKRELAGLRDDKDNLEDGIREIESRKDLAPYREVIRRGDEKTKGEAVREALKELAVMERAEAAAKEGISEETLIKEINPILKDRWLNMNPVQRFRLAMAERAEKKQIAAERDELKRLKAEKNGFSEDGTRRLPSRTPQELREAHLSGDLDAGAARAKELEERMANQK